MQGRHPIWLGGVRIGALVEQLLDRLHVAILHRGDHISVGRMKVDRGEQENSSDRCELEACRRVRCRGSDAAGEGKATERRHET